MKQIIAALKGRAPVIVFAKGAHGNWDDLADTGAQVLGVDWTSGWRMCAARLPAERRRAGQPRPVPADHHARSWWRPRPPDSARNARAAGHIFNLGHGVPPNAKLENIASLVETVRTRRNES